MLSDDERMDESLHAIRHDRRSPGPGSGDGVRVLAVDDHVAFREALRDLIAAMPGFVLAGEACSGEEGVRAFERLTPELVLMDVGMPGMGGIAAARSIRSSHPGVVIVLISVDDAALYPEAGELGSSVEFVRKQDLCPGKLKRLWERHQG